MPACGGNKVEQFASRRALVVVVLQRPRMVKSRLFLAKRTIPDHLTLKPGLLRRSIRDAQLDVVAFVEWLDPWRSVDGLKRGSPPV